ncbi:hypothetical protein MXF23_01190 [Klebsiella quasipneumoniae]|uniref:hypothetical protein n=1 Tax=Klebsiella quasipneumoniae TaxID=1463165 RepID=UPI002DBCA825|nr:hypothetical protein [Klebsiella quasipneumoniae]MEB6153460.1 hypothetical protein [Klebsiella quasipneumoniae]
MLIRYDERAEFAKLFGGALVADDEEALEGEALEDVIVIGIVTFVINRTSRNDDECPVI